MKATEIQEYVGKTVKVNGSGDLAMDYDMRKIITREVKLVKQTKSGLIQVEHEGQFYSVPLRNIDKIA